MRRAMVVLSIFVVMMAATAGAEPIVGLTTGNGLVTFDSSTPGTATAVIPITGLLSGESLVGIDIRPANSVLYGVTNQNRLYVIDRGSGAATAVGVPFSLAVVGTSFGVDFNPVVDRLRVVSDLDFNLRVNPDTGGVIIDGALAFGGGDVNAGRDPNVVGAAYANNFAGASTTTLFDIDSGLNILAIQNPPNNGTLNTVGALGMDVSDLVGFDISGLTGVAFASFTGPTGGSSQLFTIDLGTGAATLVGAIGPQTTLVDLAAQPGLRSVPEPGALLLLGSGVVALAVGYIRRRHAS